MIGALRKLSRLGVTDGMSEREVNGLVGLNVLILTQTPVGVLCILLIAAYSRALRQPSRPNGQPTSPRK
jgi:hypothetical protein